MCFCELQATSEKESVKKKSKEKKEKEKKGDFFSRPNTRFRDATMLQKLEHRCVAKITDRSSTDVLAFRFRQS